MATLKRTNSKAYRSNVFRFILDRIEFDNVSELTDRQKVEYLLAHFESEAGYKYNVQRFPNRQELLAQWLMGLPSYINLPFANYEILQEVAKLHEVEQVPPNKEDVILNNYWQHMAFMILTLNEKLSK